jgi:hypothetical protein
LRRQKPKCPKTADSVPDPALNNNKEDRDEDEKDVDTTEGGASSNSKVTLIIVFYLCLLQNQLNNFWISNKGFLKFRTVFQVRKKFLQLDSFALV